jgi:hypothetical protein
MNLPHDMGPGRRSGPNWSRINQWLLWIGLAAAVAWLFFRHDEHLLQLLPFLFILACPLMHLFGHGGHGRHGGHGGPGEAPPRKPDEPPPGGHAGHPH